MEKWYKFPDIFEKPKKHVEKPSLKLKR